MVARGKGAFGALVVRTLVFFTLRLDSWANEERCRRDCALPVNVSHSEWSVGPNPRYALTLEFLQGVGHYRPIGPTRPPHTRGHPWFPHDHELTNPSKYSDFCEAGCTFFFAENPSNITCKRTCDQTYRYDVDGGYSDLAEVARYECYDGCDLGLMRCQPGYHCDWPSTTGVPAESNWEKFANMTPCKPGTYRPNDYLHVYACFDCPPGRFREKQKGRSIESCDKCPASRYVNASGSDEHTDCLRCPAGRFSSEQGAGLCHCVTAWSCGTEDAYKRNAVFEGCNSATQECGTQEQRETYSTMRKPSEYYLCKDKEMFERRADQDLYKTNVDPTTLDTNKEVRTRLGRAFETRILISG